MSTTKGFTIWCDGEQCVKWRRGGEGEVPSSIRRKLAREGWTTKQRFKRDRYTRDYCPKCSEKAGKA